MTLHKRVMSSSAKGPILVHCSAGVGRTGTFITLDIALEQAKTNDLVDVAGIISRLREQRYKMVQSLVSWEPKTLAIMYSIGTICVYS